MKIEKKVNVKFSTPQEREGALQLIEAIEAFCESHEHCEACPLCYKGCDKLRDGNYTIAEFFDGLAEFITENEV